VGIKKGYCPKECVVTNVDISEQFLPFCLIKNPEDWVERFENIPV